MSTLDKPIVSGRPKPSLAIVQQSGCFHSEAPCNARDIVNGDVTLSALDPAQIRTVDTALMRQGFLT